MIPFNLCILVEQLEDAHQLYALAAEGAGGLLRERQNERSQACAVMLAEIRRWKSSVRKRDETSVVEAGKHGCAEAASDDSYDALMDRLFRRLRALRTVTPPISTRATDSAKDGHPRITSGA